MIHNHPVLALVYESDAVACWKGLGFALSSERKGIVARIDGGRAVNTDQLLTE
jgi:hypothetical protein